jgi:hypothetical protein
VGDLDGLITPEIGVLVSGHTEAAYRRTAERCVRLAADAEVGERCRVVARRELSLAAVGIPRYRRLYQAVEQRIADSGRRSPTCSERR